MDDELEFQVDSLDDYKKVVVRLLPLLQNYKKWGLVGDLGAGKTTFVSALARHLGASDDVTSPTYALIQEIELNNKLGFDTIYHLDLYRINVTEELLEIGVEELLDSPDLMFVEWPELLYEIAYEALPEIKIIQLEEQKRKIFINLPI